MWGPGPTVQGWGPVSGGQSDHVDCSSDKNIMLASRIAKQNLWGYISYKKQIQFLELFLNSMLKLKYLYYCKHICFSKDSQNKLFWLSSKMWLRSCTCLTRWQQVCTWTFLDENPFLLHHGLPLAQQIGTEQIIFYTIKCFTQQRWTFETI